MADTQKATDTDKGTLADAKDEGTLNNEKPKKGTGKKRGRPCKVSPSKNIVCKGIVSKPANKESCMEMIIIQIQLIKSIFTMFKSMALLKDMIFTFEKDRVIIFCKDERDNVNINITVDANKLYSYYCEEPYSIPVCFSELTELLKNIIKNYWNKLMFRSDKDTKNSKFQLQLDRDALEITDTHPVKVVNNKGVSKIPENTGEPILKFTFPALDFKQLIGKIKKCGSEYMTIRRFEDEPLDISYTQKGNVGKSHRYFRVDSKIDLKFNKPDNGYFSATVRVGDIKALAEIQICNSITWRFYDDDYFTLTGDINVDLKDPTSSKFMGIIMRMKKIDELLMEH